MSRYSSGPTVSGERAWYWWEHSWETSLKPMPSVALGHRHARCAHAPSPACVTQTRFPCEMRPRSARLCTERPMASSGQMAKRCLSAIGTMMSPGKLHAFAAGLHTRPPVKFLEDTTCWTMHSGANASSTCNYRYVLICINMYCFVCNCIDPVFTCIGMYQYVSKTFKDPMHAYDHGVAIYIIQAIIKTLHLLETTIGLAKNTPVKTLTALVHGQRCFTCQSLSVGCG